MRRFIGFIVLLALTGLARGQTAYSYRYWYDNDLSTLQEGTANGETTIEIDIGTLAKGTVHTLHLQGKDARDKWGCVCTQYFFIKEESSIESMTARYWYDNDDTTEKTTSTVHGLVELDIAGLDVGLHTLHYQTFSSEGKASPTRTQYFFIKNESDTQSATARYWFDNDEKTKKTTSTVNGTIELDLSNLAAGVHTVHYQTFNARGEVSPVRTQYFYKKDELQLDDLLCKLWIDDDVENALTFGLTDANIEIEAEDLAAGTHDLHYVVLDEGGQQIAEGMTTFEVDTQRTITITLKAPIATFSSEKGLDFGSFEGIKAYTATAFHRPTGDVIMSRVYDVPAGEGLLLVGEPGTYEVPILAAYSFYANLLVGTPEEAVIAQTADGYDNFLLSFRNGEPGFFLAEDGSTLAAGKAYLRVPGNEVAGKQRLRLRFDEMPDGVEFPLEETEESATYNLAGQRIAGSQMQKGIYIKDGKKVLVR